MKKHFPVLAAGAMLLVASMACSWSFSIPPAPSLPGLPALSTPTGLPPQSGLTPTAPVAPTSPVVASPTVGVVESGSIVSLVDLYAKVNPGVVAIQILGADGQGALGSGFVYDEDGHIVTNRHVVDGGEQIEVDFSSGLKVRGQVVGMDPDSDLAVIKVNVPAESLVPLALGDSDLLQIGQPVVAIGNPFGLSGTMTSGIVSALGRTLDSERAAPGGGMFSSADAIQTDAAINPGNSGGPLLNLAGEVIGVNRAIESETGVNSGVGFAISVNIVKRVVPKLIEDGQYSYPYLGMTSLPEVSLLEQEALGLPQSVGVYVTGVVPGGPADRAGVRAGSTPTRMPDLMAGGDLIIAIDGVEVRDFGDLITYLVAHAEVGQTVTLTVLQDGETVDRRVTLEARP